MSDGNATKRDILTITFSLIDKPHTLEYGEGVTGRAKKDVKTIAYTIQDVGSMGEVVTGELNDDKGASFQEFTNKLSMGIKTLRSLLPEGVASYYNKTTVDGLSKKHDEFMTGKPIEKEVIVIPDKLKEKMKIIDDLWTKNGSKTLTIDEVKGIITKVCEEEKVPPEESSEVIKLADDKIFGGSRVLGVYKKYNDPTRTFGGSWDRTIFITPTHIVTDGYKIISFIDVTEKGVEIKGDVTYSGLLWKLKDDYDKAFDNINSTDEKVELYGGERMTLSKKPVKHRTTRRNRLIVK